MSSTYKAVLHSDRIEWIDPPPDCPNPVSIHITLVKEVNAPRSRGDAMADSLSALAREGVLTSIPDPIAWQRDLQQERPLPHCEG